MSRGERQDLGAIEPRLRNALIGFFVRRTGNRAEAEELAQETLARAITSSANVQSLEAYVFQIATNLLRDRARSAAVRAAYRDAVLQEPGRDLDQIDPFRVAVGREHLALLSSAIAALPDKTRRIFTLYRIEQIDKQTIADSFGLSIRAIELHIHKAMSVLLDRMGDAL